MKDFKDKVAVVTGAASGIGYGLAERCAKEGMKVVLAGINEDTLQKAKNAIKKKSGATTLVVKCDVSKANDVESLTKKTLDAFGAVHLLFNNAGVTMFSTAWESTLADWQWVLGVNLWGVIHGLHFFVPIMLRQNVECHIVNTASTLGVLPLPMNNPYAVSKHAVVALSETLYHELAQKTQNIGVSVLIPGYVRTKAMYGERNRPVKLKNKLGEGIDTTDPDVQALLKAYREGINSGMLPEKVADITFQAIKEDKFYIFAGNEFAIPIIQTRMEDIIHQRNPTTVPKS